MTDNGTEIRILRAHKYVYYIGMHDTVDTLHAQLAHLQHCIRIISGH